jgi:hypothetical protein
VKKAKFKMRQEFNSRLTYSLFCVHLSNQKFSDGVGDARTTKLPRRESAALAGRITDKSVSAQCAPSARQRKGPGMPGQPSLPPRAKSKLANILRRGGGCSPVRTCLSLHFSEMQGDFAKMQGDRERMPAKSDQISAA